MAGFRQHPNDRSRSRGDSALAPKGSSLRHRVFDHRERRLLGPGIQPSTPGTTTIEDLKYENGRFRQKPACGAPRFLLKRRARLHNHADGRQSPRISSGSRPMAAKQGRKAAHLAQILPLSASEPLDRSPRRTSSSTPPAARSNLRLCAGSHGTRSRDPALSAPSFPADSSSRCWSTRCPSVAYRSVNTGVSCSRRRPARRWALSVNSKV